MAIGLGALLPGSYKGIKLYISRENLTQLGQKWLTHDYPKSGQRYMEAMGEIPPEFEVDIVFAGLTYQGDFQTFKAAVTDTNPGRLVMPTFGIFNNVVAFPTSAAHNYSDLNAITLTVKFTITVSQPSPTTSTATQENVFDNGNTGISNISSSMSKNLQFPISANNLAVIGNDLGMLINTVGVATGFARLAGAVYKTVAQLAANPSSIPNALFGQLGYLTKVYLGFNNSTPSTKPNTASNNFTPTANGTPFTTMANLTNIGYSLSTSIQDINSGIILPSSISDSTAVPLWDTITTEQVQRNQNRLALINSVRLWAMIMMLEQAAIANYLTNQDLINTLNMIDSKYSGIIENDTTNIIIQDVKTDLEAVKNSTFAVLNSLQGAVYQTTSINLFLPVPAVVLTYDLYGEYIQTESDLQYYKGILVNLNPSQPIHKFSGQVTVLKI